MSEDANPALKNVDVPDVIWDNLTEYDTHYEVDLRGTGGQHAIRYNDSAVIQNIRFIVGSGGAVQIRPNASFNSTDQPVGWEIRNVSIEGRTPQHVNRVLYASVGEGGTGLVENVWMADGDDGQANVSNPGDYPGASGNNAGMRGNLVVRNTNIQNWTSHGFYGSRGRGEIHFERCYHTNNQMSQFRLLDGSLTECYARAATSPTADRALWVWGDVGVDGCVLDGAANSRQGINFASGGSSPVAYVSNTVYTGHDGGDFNDLGGNTVEENPVEMIPAGVPTEPEHAYMGYGNGEYGDGDYGNGDNMEYEHALRMEGQAEYYFEVSENLRPHPDIAQWLTEGDAYGENWAEWYLTGSWTEWQFNGEITELQYVTDEGVEFFLNGERVDPDTLVGSGGDTGGSDPVEAPEELYDRIDALESDQEVLEGRLDEYEVALEKKSGIINSLREKLGVWANE